MELQTDNHTIGVPLMDQVTSKAAQQNKEVVQSQPHEGKCSLLESDKGSYSSGLYDRPLSCFGCGIGWFSFITGFAFPLIWYCATFLYFGNYYLKDPRERAGLAASAIAALIFSVAVLIALLVMLL